MAEVGLITLGLLIGTLLARLLWPHDRPEPADRYRAPGIGDIEPDHPLTVVPTNVFIGWQVEEDRLTDPVVLTDGRAHAWQPDYK